jgi:hypothetical protein
MFLVFTQPPRMLHFAVQIGLRPARVGLTHGARGIAFGRGKRLQVKSLARHGQIRNGLMVAFEDHQDIFQPVL